VVVTGDDYTPLITYAPYLVNGTAADRYFFTLHEAATMLLGNSPSPPQNWAVSLSAFQFLPAACTSTAVLLYSTFVCSQLLHYDLWHFGDRNRDLFARRAIQRIQGHLLCVSSKSRRFTGVLLTSSFVFSITRPT
jgi:hypothetical protein